MNTAELSPRSEALAYRIWAYANPLGWDCTIAELADALDAKFGSVRNVVSMKGWIGRLRSGRVDNEGVYKIGSFGFGVKTAERDFISKLHLEGASE